MVNYLVLRLDGVMQAWGDHTFEDLRPVVGFPTRSGLLGLLAACLGIDRADVARLERLDNSIEFTVRVDNHRVGSQVGRVKLHKLTDFHTVEGARKVNGKANENPVVSRREYLCDVTYTVVISSRPGASISLESLKEAVSKPVFTPFLGRRSCPLSRPLFLGWVTDLESPLDVLAKFEPLNGRIYSESSALDGSVKMRVRDVPLRGKARRFASRQVTLHREMKHVSE